MNLLKLLLVLAPLFGGYKWWHAHSADQAADQAMLNASPNGFVALQRPARVNIDVKITNEMRTPVAADFHTPTDDFVSNPTVSVTG